MTIRRYAIRTVWRVPGTLPEVVAVLDDVEALPAWWPAVYLTADVVNSGGADGVGRVVNLRTTGWLPHTLTWASTLTEPLTSHGFALAAGGDMTGSGRWTFEQDGPEVVLEFEWDIGATKPLVRRLDRLIKPLFVANHRWAMARGEESLRLELRRRRATAAHVVADIPSPPQPTFQFLTRFRTRVLARR